MPSTGAPDVGRATSAPYEDERPAPVIVYCTRCVMPDTKPDLLLDEEGVCNACRSFERRGEVDWTARERELVELLERFANPGGSNYDCIVPVSGGKDSTYQVLRLLELGANPLVVTATTDHLTDIGRHNLENIRTLGVDHLEVTTNPVVRRRINRLALTSVGDISWPEHVTIFTIPVRIAVQMRIPLIVWGENSQNEYGGPATAAEGRALTRRWLEEFGGLLGLRVSDLVGQDGIRERDLISYRYPSDAELAASGISGIFLGHFVPWDGYANALVAQGYGFRTYPQMVEGSLANYENLDNGYHGIHDYFKWLKFAFGRASDIASLHVRRGRLRRAEAVDLVKRHDGKFPWTYVGVSLEESLAEIDLTLAEFVRVCDRFTNKRLFVTDDRGQLVKDARGDLTRRNDDNLAHPGVLVGAGARGLGT